MKLMVLYTLFYNTIVLATTVPYFITCGVKTMILTFMNFRMLSSVTLVFFSVFLFPASVSEP